MYHYYYWDKDSEIHRGIEEVINKLGITVVAAYHSASFPYGCIDIQLKQLYGVDYRHIDQMLKIATLKELYEIKLLTSLSLSHKEIEDHLSIGN